MWKYLLTTRDLIRDQGFLTGDIFVQFSLNAFVLWDWRQRRFLSFLNSFGSWFYQISCLVLTLDPSFFKQINSLSRSPESGLAGIRNICLSTELDLTNFRQILVIWHLTIWRPELLDKTEILTENVNKACKQKYFLFSPHATKSVQKKPLWSFVSYFESGNY